MTTATCPANNLIRVCKAPWSFTFCSNRALRRTLPSVFFGAMSIVRPGTNDDAFKGKKASSIVLPSVFFGAMSIVRPGSNDDAFNGARPLFCSSANDQNFF